MKRSAVKKSSGDLLTRPPTTRVLQRKCACGNRAESGSKCNECASNETLQRKAKTESEVGQVPASVKEVLNSPGQPLDSETRSFMEPRFGRDFSQVRVHTDAQAAKSADAVSALAYTVGRDVVFGAGEYSPGSEAGRGLLAHELSHVEQQSELQAGQLRSMSGKLETEADHKSALIAGVTPTNSTHAGPPNGLGIQRKEKKGEVEPTLLFSMILSFAGKLDAGEARDAFAAYKKMSKKDRRAAFDAHYPTEIPKLLRALPAEDASLTYRNEVRELLRWIEEAETRKASGLSDEEMATKKGVDMKTKAEADAKAAKAAKGSTAAPTQAEIQAAHEKNVEETSVEQASTNRWLALTPKKRREMLAAGKKAIEDLIAHATKTHAELKLTKASFKLDFNAVEKRGQNILAMSETVAGKPVAVVGFDFVTAVQVNPAYALSTVVHEVFGHPEYGVYGAEYHLAIYDKAVKKAGFKKQRADTPKRLMEMDAYAYQETEIYSLMRELPYWTPVSAKDETAHPGLTALNFDPKDGIETRVGIIKTQWKSTKLDIPLLHGLHSRFRNDPRITKMALDAFVKALKAHYTKDEVKEITK